MEDWKKVIWSDETLIRVGVDNRHRRVIRPDGKGLDERYLMPSLKSTQVTIMVWVCFCDDMLSPILAFDKGGIGAAEYTEVLYDGLLSMIDDVLGPLEDLDTVRTMDVHELLFMHDNAPCHNNQEVRDLLKDYNIPIMSWPPQSPDLNPMEQLWPELKHRFHIRFLELGLRPSTTPAAAAKYISIIQEVWAEIARSLLRRLLESMPERVAAVIAAKGGHTKY